MDKQRQPETKQPEAKELETLKKELAHKAKDLEDYADHLKRLQADFENFVKRAEKDRQAVIDVASESVITKLLIVVDDFERALHELKKQNKPELVQGIEMIFKELHQILDHEGVKAIPAVGQKFDPFKHEVILKEKKDGIQEGIVLDELVKGYEMKGKVIRYSKVKIAA